MAELSEQQIDALRARLRRLSVDLNEHRLKGRAIVARRRGLLVQLVNAGVPQAELARDCGVSPNAIADTLGKNAAR